MGSRQQSGQQETETTMRSAPLLVVLVLLVLVTGEAPCPDIVTKWTVWEGGLAATLHVPVTETISHWNVSIVFNKQFTDINFYNGLSDVSAGREFLVYNEAWSGDKEPGAITAFRLLGDFDQGEEGDEIDITSIGLNGQKLC